MRKRGSHASRTSWELRNNAVQDHAPKMALPGDGLPLLALQDDFQLLYSSSSRTEAVTGSLGTPFRRPQAVSELAPERIHTSVRPRCLPHSLKSSSPSASFCWSLPSLSEQPWGFQQQSQPWLKERQREKKKFQRDGKDDGYETSEVRFGEMRVAMRLQCCVIHSFNVVKVQSFQKGPNSTTIPTKSC